MRGKRVLGENSRWQSFSKKKKSFSDVKVKARPKNVVVIDLDDDDDAPESMDKFGIPEAPREAPRDRGKTHVESVINIDDDDDDIGVCAGTGVVVDDADMASDANSSRSRYFRFYTMGSSVGRDTENHEFVAKKTTAFQFSKCKRPCFTKSPGKNRYGLDPTYDDVSTDSDSSDCKMGSDPESWTKASLRRKRPQSVYEDQTSACESNNGEERHSRPVSGKADHMEENQAEFSARDSGNVNTSYRTSPVSVNMDDDQKSEERAESVLEKEFPWRTADFQPEGGSGTGSRATEDVSDDLFGNKAEEPFPQESCTAPEECDHCKSFSCRCTPIFSNWEDFSDSWPPFRSFEQEVCDKQATPPRTPSTEKDNRDSQQAFVRNSNQFDGTQVKDDHRPNENLGGGSEDVFFRHVDSEGTTLHNSTQDRPNLNLNEEHGNVECVQEDHVTQPVETCIITDRQKLKDTEEFRRAEKEEWAARQRELRIQAEEAQKLRRRKKAEILRLNNIERRQKERVEEVRENEKKNAEDINLKEQLRGEIRKEINKLEIASIDMASLLRGLGIQVNGGFKPMSKDVNAAYKRALLKFHPDRASRVDIRQQVESEEKFKLISRMKEKFLTSCC